MKNGLFTHADRNAYSEVIKGFLAMFEEEAANHKHEKMRERAKNTILAIHVACRRYGTDTVSAWINSALDELVIEVVNEVLHGTEPTPAAKLRERRRQRKFDREFEAMRREWEMEVHDEPA